MVEPIDVNRPALLEDRTFLSGSRDETKPTVVVSRCLGFCKCRYNGDVISVPFVRELLPYVNVVTVCPEVDIGLGIPRNPVRLLLQDGKVELYQSSEEKTYTEVMREYSEGFLATVGAVHGFILKGRSPSCGIKDVKIYKGKDKGAASEKGIGIFATYAIDYAGDHPVEEEGRLTNYAIREHFLTRLFTFFRFEKCVESGRMRDLIAFHATHKYLLLAYNQSQYRTLGSIVANHEKKPFAEVVSLYREHLGKALSRLPAKSNFINTFQHIFGYFSDQISPREKAFLLDRFEKFREDRVHGSVVINLLHTYVIQYNKEYLLDQVIWMPYPEALLDIHDSGK